jgi:hypothetical protein
MSDYQKKTIVIKEAKESADGTWVYVKDPDGVSYSFFKEFQGVALDVYLQWQLGNHGNRYAIGDAATISYKEKPNPKVAYSVIRTSFPRLRVFQSQASAI